MFLNLRQIRTPHEHFDRIAEPGLFAVDRDNFTVLVPVALAFDVDKDKDQFRLAGGLQTRVELPCSRCLEPYETPIDAAFDLRYQPRSTNTGEGEREVQDDDLTTSFYENDEIDLGQLIREQIYLSLPMKPLCRENCLGLCPVCGTNLNKGACSCKRNWDDPRLAVLNTLKTEG